MEERLRQLELSGWEKMAHAEEGFFRAMSKGQFFSSAKRCYKSRASMVDQQAKGRGGAADRTEIADGSRHTEESGGEN